MLLAILRVLVVAGLIYVLVAMPMFYGSANAACTPTSERITSGTFPTTGGNTNTVPGWTVGGTYAASGPWALPTGRVNLGTNGLIFQRDASTITTLAQNVTAINDGTRITLGTLSWLRTLQYGTTGNAILTVSYAGTVYATINTRALAGATAASTQTPTVTASNGATVNMATLPSITGAAYQTSTPTTLIITLPNGVATSGQVLFTFTASSDPGEVNDILFRTASMLSCPNPTVTLTKISNGAVGGFTFTGTNGWSSQTITTVTSGTGVAGAAQTLSLASTSTTITEAVPAGYVLASVNCTGMGTGGTAMLSGSTIILDAAATAPQANINCTFTNNKLPTIVLTKTSSGGVSSFTFNGNNGFGAAQTITTVTVGTPVSGALRTLAAASTPTTITETIPSGYVVTSISCSGMGAGGTASPNLATGVVLLDAAATAPGSNITCAYANAVINPAIMLNKSWGFASGGDVNGNGLADTGDQIIYTYLVTNTGNVDIVNITISDLHEGTALPTTPTRVVTNETLITSGPNGTSSDASINGSWDLLTPGSQIRFRYTHTVVLSEVDAG